MEPSEELREAVEGSFAFRMQSIARALGLELRRCNHTGCGTTVTHAGQKFRVVALDHPSEGAVSLTVISNVCFPRFQLPGEVWESLELRNRDRSQGLYTKCDGPNNSWFSVLVWVARADLSPEKFEALVEDAAPSVADLDEFLRANGYPRRSSPHKRHPEESRQTPSEGVSRRSSDAQA